MKHRHSPYAASCLLLLIPLVLTACGATTGNADASVNPAQSTQTCVPAETVEVVSFHGTNRCISCIAVGNLAKETLHERFVKEMEFGRVVFRDINGELPEHRDIVTKYQARGSSLFVNAVTQGKDNIEEDVTVWRLAGSPEQYKQYFEQKIRTLLSCSS